MNKHKSRRASKVKAGKDAARAKYKNMGIEAKNKKLRQERHKKRVAKPSNPDYVLPSTLKRAAKRKSIAKHKQAVAA